MNKNSSIYILGFIALCLVVGYLVGATKTVIFDATPDGRYSYVSQCDSEDDNGNCLHYAKAERMPLKEAANINGQLWGKILGGSSIFILIGIAALKERKNRLKAKNK